MTYLMDNFESAINNAEALLPYSRKEETVGNIFGTTDEYTVRTIRYYNDFKMIGAVRFNNWNGSCELHIF